MKKYQFAVMATVSMLISSQSFAARTHMYHGSICTARDVTSYTQWGIHNNSTSTAWVQCPLPVPAASGAKVISVYVHGYNRGANNNEFSCALWHHDLKGNLIASSSRQGTGSDFEELKFSSLNQTAAGSWSLYCSLPGRNTASVNQLSHISNIEVYTDDS